jgi:hypothetical protein
MVKYESDDILKKKEKEAQSRVETLFHEQNRKKIINCKSLTEIKSLKLSCHNCYKVLERLQEIESTNPEDFLYSTFVKYDIKEYENKFKNFAEIIFDFKCIYCSGGISVTFKPSELSTFLLKDLGVQNG